MKPLLFFLFLPFIGYCQPMSLDIMMEWFKHRKQDSILISEIRSFGYKELSNKNEVITFEGPQSGFRLFYKNGEIDGIGYLTRDSSTYASWPDLLLEKEFFHYDSKHRYEAWLGKTCQALIFRDDEIYSLFIIKKSDDD